MNARVRFRRGGSAPLHPFGKLGADPFPGTPESLEKFVDGDIEKWGRHVKPAGIQSEGVRS